MATIPRGGRIGAEHPPRKQITVVQGKPIEEALRLAVRQALLEHKRAGNRIAMWMDGKVVLIPAEEIQIESEINKAQNSSLGMRKSWNL